MRFDHFAARAFQMRFKSKQIGNLNMTELCFEPHSKERETRLKLGKLKMVV